ncbi:hypothetical protein AB6D11_18545 [Vibrio splendidus]
MNIITRNLGASQCPDAMKYVKAFLKESGVELTSGRVDGLLIVTTAHSVQRDLSMMIAHESLPLHIRESETHLITEEQRQEWREEYLDEELDASREQYFLLIQSKPVSVA